MKDKKILLKAALLVLILLINVDFSFAQGLTTPCNGGDPDVDCPIDSGIMAMAGAFALCGFIKISFAKK